MGGFPCLRKEWGHGSAPGGSVAGITDKSMGEGLRVQAAHPLRQQDRQLRNAKDQWQAAHLDDAFGK